MTAWRLSQAGSAGVQASQQPPLCIRLHQASTAKLCYGHGPHTHRLHVQRSAAAPAGSTADSDFETQQQQRQQQEQQQQQQAVGQSSSSSRQQQQQQAAAGEKAAVLLKHRLSECPVCGGTGRTACKDCSGAGFLPRGGYSKKNPLNTSRAVGSKWTAMTETLGWRHFRVIAVRKLDKHKHNTYLLLQASCDSSAQLWVNGLTLRNRACWAAGWLSMSELLGEADGSGGVANSGHKCHTCSGLGYRACAACDGRGRADLVEV